MTDRKQRRGRPPLDWLGVTGLVNLPTGTPVLVQLVGDKRARPVGRKHSSRADQTILVDAAGALVVVDHLRLARARILEAIYENGDPVLKRGVATDRWRGGVVRTDGTRVLVEQIDGTFVWLDETDLEPAEARDTPEPLPRGPVPARTA